jgi:DNA repair ATPase RecN
MGKNKRSKTNNDSDFDEDYFDDYRQERRRKRETRRERRKNKRSVDSVYYVDDEIEQLEMEEEEVRYD